MVYPKIKKYQTPAGPITSDSYGIKGDPSKMSTLGDKPQVNPMAVVQGISTAGTLALSAYQSKNPIKTNDLGIGSQTSNEATLQGGLTGMNAGMSLGSSFGPQGAVIGAAAGLVVGGVAGYVNNQKEKASNRKLTSSIRKDQRTYLDQGFKQDTSIVNEEAKRQRSLIPSNYRMFSAKKGGIFPKFQKGGFLYTTSEGKQYSKLPDFVNRFGHMTYPQTPDQKIVGTNFNTGLIIRNGELQDTFNKLNPIRKAVLNNPGIIRTPLQIKNINQQYYQKESLTMLKNGGITPHAVIPSGSLHSEKNNLGTKGLPVVHSGTNEKKAEVEREEIIFTKPQTDFIMKYHNELKTDPTDQDYEEFGKLVGIFIDGAKDMNE
jgi:outer membrane lipoprotein SlyB